MSLLEALCHNTRAERRKLLYKNTRTRVDIQMVGTKKNTFQHELKNRFIVLEELYDTDRNYPTKCEEHSKTNQETEKAENIVTYKRSNEET